MPPSQYWLLDYMALGEFYTLNLEAAKQLRSEGTFTGKDNVII